MARSQRRGWVHGYKHDRLRPVAAIYRWAVISQLKSSRSITVTLNFPARVPRAFGYLEEKLKGYLQGKISRGKVEAGVTVVDTGAAHTAVDINHELAASISSMRCALQGRS